MLKVNILVKLLIFLELVLAEIKYEIKIRDFPVWGKFRVWESADFTNKSANSKSRTLTYVDVAH